MTTEFLQDQKRRQSFVDGASRYAEMDRSDPFAFSRAVAHARIGMLDGDEYDATKDHYTATNGVQHVIYKGARRA